MRYFLVLLFVVSCSEYKLTGKDSPMPGLDVDPAVLDTAQPLPTDTASSIDSAEPEVDESTPVAGCSVSPNPVTPPTESAVFSGASSYDPGGNPIVTYYWELIDQPEGSSATLPYNSGVNVSGFYADLAGEYVAELTVTNDKGNSDSCRASLEAIPAQNLWVEMFWEYSGDDMDLHLLAPGGSLESSSDCYYSNCTPATQLFFPMDWGISGYDEDNPTLDLDDIPNTGPENINISQPQTDGVYTVYVHDYPGSVYSGANAVTVNIYLNGSLVWTDTKAIAGEDSYTPYAIINWSTLSITSL